MNSAVFLFAVLFITLFLGVPISLCLLISSYASLLIFEPRTNLMVIVQRMFVGSDNYVFMAVPFFILAGELMLKGGISNRLVNFAKVAFWWMPATLANTTTIASAFFGAISGSNPATVSAIGGTMIPSMVKDGYPKAVAAAIAAASGTLGVIIPPSIPMVIYGITASVSVPKLFIGGAVPGIMLAGIICGVNILCARRYSKPIREVHAAMIANGITFWGVFREAVWALLMPGIILGGIYGGLFTPTEAAVVSAFYAFLVGMFVYRELQWKDLAGIFTTAALSTGTILFVIACCAPFAWFMTSKGIPGMVSTIILNALSNKFLLILAMNGILLFLGCFLDTGIIILLVTQIFLPIAASVGISPLALGLIMVINTSIGMITPPMAVNLFVATRLSGCTIEQISRWVIPFLVAETLFVISISNFPGFLEWLPNLIG
ncbi:MAG: TRAP transporter large permease [Planctomycetes bacterium]|nr:TRAP transporter large permease [Planctomycetota bacterium]